MNETSQTPVKPGGKGGLILGIVNLLLLIGVSAAVIVLAVAVIAKNGTKGGVTNLVGGGVNLAELYKKVNPSVVYLYNADTELALNEYGQIKYQETASLGSGFVYDQEGYIITNAHVIADQFGTKVHPSVEVVFPETSKNYVAKVLAADPLNDIAVVKIQERNLPISEFGNIDEVNVGDSVFAVGSPGGANEIMGNLRNTLTAGVISGKNRSFGIIGLGDALYLAGQIPSTIPSLAHSDLIQTDAHVNHGNSGGPLYNAAGKVVGINTLVETSQGQQGLNFSVPVNKVKRVAEDVKAMGKLTASYIGIATLPVDRITSKLYKFPETEGAMVYIILPNSPAKNSKLLPLDIITQVNGVKVKNSVEYENELLKIKAGDEVSLEVNSRGAKNTIKIKTIETPFLKGI